jgi:hypothetical protein
MTTETPKVGDVSADGQFRWDGAEWAPLARGERETTPWTLPMQRVVAGFFVAYVAVQLVTNLLFVTTAALERTLRASNSALDPDQVRSAASLGYVLGWVTLAIIAVAVLALAVGSLRGLRWVFWIDVAALALMSVGLITNGLSLAGSAAQTLPPAAIAFNLLVSLAALGLLVWFVVAAVRFGPWAMRRPGT